VLLSPSSEECPKECNPDLLWIPGPNSSFTVYDGEFIFGAATYFCEPCRRCQEVPLVFYEGEGSWYWSTPWVEGTGPMNLKTECDGEPVIFTLIGDDGSTGTVALYCPCPP